MAEISDIVAPIVHTNGTSRDALIQQACDARLAVIEAINALERASPNGRDYYLKPGLLQKAQAQHERRIAALVAVRDSLAAEIDAIDATAG